MYLLVYSYLCLLVGDINTMGSFRIERELKPTCFAKKISGGQENLPPLVNLCFKIFYPFIWASTTAIATIFTISRTELPNCNT